MYVYFDFTLLSIYVQLFFQITKILIILGPQRCQIINDVWKILWDAYKYKGNLLLKIPPLGGSLLKITPFIYFIKSNLCTTFSFKGISGFWKSLGNKEVHQRLPCTTTGIYSSLQNLPLGSIDPQMVHVVPMVVISGRGVVGEGGGEGGQVGVAVVFLFFSSCKVIKEKRNSNNQF